MIPFGFHADSFATSSGILCDASWARTHAPPTRPDPTLTRLTTPLWKVDSSTHSLRQPFVVPSYENTQKGVDRGC